MTITTRYLKTHQACDEQMKLFKQIFPSGKAEVTKANYKIAKKAGLDFYWLCYTLKISDWRTFSAKRDKARKWCERKLAETYRANAEDCDEIVECIEKRFYARVEKVLFDILASL